jgi:2-oxoglutarate ferredoxin oxidoreductase subunit beta
VPILKAAVRHNGFALIDIIISPCVSFNDHDTSTKSYRYTRDHYNDVAGRLRPAAPRDHGRRPTPRPSA